jgi:NAD+ kinase
MAKTFQLIILARDQRAEVQAVLEKLTKFLEQQSNTKFVIIDSMNNLKLSEQDADLIVTLGGDGAILRACRELGEHQLPIMGINLGRLGFLADLTLEEFQKEYEAISNGQFQVVEHLMFDCRLAHENGESESFIGLNEVVVHAEKTLSMIDVLLEIDGEHVTTFSADGLIISTPVGSTAHSLSAGGPILQQELKNFVINPICPHTLTNRPIVDSASRLYCLKLPEASDNATMVIDGQVSKPFVSGDYIEVREANVTFKLARLKHHSYYSTLHRKLGWSGQPDYRRKKRGS